MADDTLLKVEDLRTYFFTRRGVVKAVDGISFTLSKGESLGLVGESGSGKSVTCLSILRLVPQPAGKIVRGSMWFNGQDLLRKSEAEMRRIRGCQISMVLQDPMTSLNPVFTIGSQIGEVVRIHQKLKGKVVAEKVRDMLRLVGIPSAETRMADYPHQLSGGMRQRVCGAIALSCQPRLLIADEPTTSLDVTIQAQYLRLLKEMQQRFNLGLIFITHDFGIVARMCDRVAVMYAGRIVEQAAVRDLFNHPLHPYTIALMRCLPQLEAEMDELPTLEGQPPSLAQLPEGCHFQPRCDCAEEKCRHEYPPEVAADHDHVVSCWRMV